MSIGKTIFSIMSNPDDLLKLEPEEVAAVMLETFNSVEHLQLNRHDYLLPRTVHDYPPAYHERLLKSLSSGWGYMEREGFIAEQPGKPGHFFITELGKQIKNLNDLNAYRAAHILPKYLLHPIIARKVELAFRNAEYDTAVFQALREVEVAVRAAGGFAATDIGVALMRKAFNPASGPLREESAIELERLALADLFAGLIGSYKNPRSHRNVVLDATEAVEIIVFASHLLKIVDARSASRKEPDSKTARK